ncbi:MAG: hypothetical protein MUP71_06095 [Candidatus Aminicenantes bacterium]|nr:hypothetical protein [Candidatus Aminicenantes bacterium]
MKKIRTMVVLGLFLGISVGNLFAQYLDVGDDPGKIEIASTKNIIYNSKPVGGYAWSHDGEWFLGANNDGGYIMDKNGAFLQKLPRKFNYGQATLFSDNKRIFYDFWENKKHYYAIYDLQTKQETVLQIDPLKEHFIDISPQGDILFMQIIVVARKISYSFFSFIPENGSRQELGVISGDRIYYSNFRNFRYLDINNLLLLVSDNGAKLKKYDFSVKKFINITSFELSSPTYSRLHDSRHVVVVSFWDMVYLYEASGALLGKFRAFFDRGGPDKHGINPDLIPGEEASNRTLAPNGNLILLRMARSGGEGDNQSNEVYLFNFKEKSVRFPMPYHSSSTEWSPKGDRMLNGDLIVYLRKKN